MGRSTSWLLLVFLFGATGSAVAAETHSAMRFTGTGAQVYVCSGSGDQFAWTLKAPDATLTDAHKKVVGKHFAGPTWQAQDGSSVVGEAIVTSPSPAAGAIPWLVLHAKSHSGSCMMSDVAYIVRTNTKGGVAPTSGCDSSHSGAEKRVSYSATYLFLPGASQ